MLEKSGHWSTAWFACRLSKSISGEEIARELISILSVTYGVRSELLLAAIYIYMLGVLCCFTLFVCLTLLASFFHLSFKNMYTHLSYTLVAFSTHWTTLVKISKHKSLQTSSIYESLSSVTVPRPGSCRSRRLGAAWPRTVWSKCEVVKMVMCYFGDIEPFLLRNDDIGPTITSKLLSFFANQQKKGLLHLEIAASVDWGEPFVN